MVYGSRGRVKIEERRGMEANVRWPRSRVLARWAGVEGQAGLARPL
jgi:hypothetical protein